MVFNLVVVEALALDVRTFRHRHAARLVRRRPHMGSTALLVTIVELISFALDVRTLGKRHAALLMTVLPSLLLLLSLLALRLTRFNLTGFNVIGVSLGILLRCLALGVGLPLAESPLLGLTKTTGKGSVIGPRVAVGATTRRGKARHLAVVPSLGSWTARGGVSVIGTTRTIGKGGVVGPGVAISATIRWGCCWPCRETLWCDHSPGCCWLHHG
jgi:hypothetical protein